MVKINSNIFIKIGKGTFKEKRSNFISFSFFVENLNDIKFHLTELRNIYPEANHICYAYRLLVGKTVNEFATDSGEPRGSSGIPILNQLKRHKLINSVVFVVRYSGGNKLGINGLINAYSEATLDCLNNSEISLWEEKEIYIIETNYRFLGIVEKIIRDYNGKSINNDFTDKIKIFVEIIKKDSVSFYNSFNELNDVKILKKY